MTLFLVEAYTPATTKIAAVEARAQRAADQLALTGTDVHYVSAIFVPEDEMCLLVYEAASPEHAREASRRAGIECERVVEAAGGLEVGSLTSEEASP
jgi:hypothetical protein